jgi:hypothetical protein
MMALSKEAEAHARQALREARRRAGLSPLIDDEPTLRVIVAVIGSHLERQQAEIPNISTNIHNPISVSPVLKPCLPVQTDGEDGGGDTGGGQGGEKEA